jgi:Fe-S-cluster-containing dehydrogenase component
MLSPKTAERLGVKNEEAVELKYQGRTIVAPAWVMPGHADESVTVFLGYGRTRSGRVGTGTGFDAGWIRPLATPWIGTGLEVRATGEKWALATTQTQSTMEGREPLRVATLDEYQKNPVFAQTELGSDTLSLYPAVNYAQGNQWGMAIDLTPAWAATPAWWPARRKTTSRWWVKSRCSTPAKCTGSASTAITAGRRTNPQTYFQPVACVQCEDAPCEVVCPVAATVHDAEGLNNMVYNRCVGTRYCSNNCPYKVRRFNFLLFTDWETESSSCSAIPTSPCAAAASWKSAPTACSASITRRSRRKSRTARSDGEIVPACAATCPSQAIMFGDLNDPKSRVSSGSASR